MKKIDLRELDVNKMDTNLLPAFLDFRILFKRLLKSYKESRDTSAGRFQEIMSIFTAQEKVQFSFYLILILSTIFSVVLSYYYLSKVHAYRNDLLISSAQTKEVIQNIQDISARNGKISEMEERAAQVNKLFPDSPLEEEIVVDLTYHLQNNQMPVPKQFSWQMVAPLQIENEEIRSLFDVYSYELSSSGTYSQIDNFIKDLRANIRLIDIKKIALAPRIDGKLNFRASLWSYNQKN